jgi:hypothetical protein
MPREESLLEYTKCHLPSTGTFYIQPKNFLPQNIVLYQEDHTSEVTANLVVNRLPIAWFQRVGIQTHSGHHSDDPIPEN